MTTAFFDDYDYAAARNEVESFFWSDLADNYLEMAKQRLYGEVDSRDREGALFTLHEALQIVLKLFAPILPFVTDAIYRGMFAGDSGRSIHTTEWPGPKPEWHDPVALAVGEVLVQVATAARRYKSDRNLPLGTPVAGLELRCPHPDLAERLAAAVGDLRSITRAGRVDLVNEIDPNVEKILAGDTLEVGIRIDPINLIKSILQFKQQYAWSDCMGDNELPKTYDFKSTEQRLYQWWEEQGYFKPANDPNLPGFNPDPKPFVISIPPPNVTGELHLGHAMFVSMEDLMIRYHRMKGIPTLWVPGTDHAGIATQLQVEKMLAQEGLKREEIGREEFLRRTWAWKEKYGGIITRQIRRLGASCDWTRERFTLDAGLSRAVREAFVRLYEKGLIYRGPRMINWSPGLKTAVSDLEVEYTQEPGTLYYFKYLLADHPDQFIPVATTRPETILGDTAVAVHPEDPALPAVRWPESGRPGAGAGNPGHCGQLCRPRIRDRRAQDHPGARPERLRDWDAARSAGDPGAGRNRAGQ